MPFIWPHNLIKLPINNPANHLHFPTVLLVTITSRFLPSAFFSPFMFPFPFVSIFCNDIHWIQCSGNKEKKIKIRITKWDYSMLVIRKINKKDIGRLLIHNHAITRIDAHLRFAFFSPCCWFYFQNRNKLARYYNASSIKFINL